MKHKLTEKEEALIAQQETEQAAAHCRYAFSQYYNRNIPTERKTMINLGDKVRDKITGYEGIVVAKTHWLNNCVRVVVQSQTLHEGRPVDNQQFDIEQVEVVTAAAIVIEKEQTGGPKDFTPSRPTVRR